MTREEIIDGLEIYTVGRLKKDRVHITVEELQKFIDAIKTLGQELVIDKIKAEIEQLPITDTAIRLVGDILDKYKAESEPQESEVEE